MEKCQEKERSANWIPSKYLNKKQHGHSRAKMQSPRWYKGMKRKESYGKKIWKRSSSSKTKRIRNGETEESKQKRGKMLKTVAGQGTAEIVL